MRIATALLARAPQNEAKVPFQMLLPLELKTTVSGKSDKTNNVCCIQEMTLLFTCLKANEFSQETCGKEISNFTTCYSDHMKNKAVKKENEKKGIYATGISAKKMGFKQINRILAGFPPSKKPEER